MRKNSYLYRLSGRWSAGRIGNKAESLLLLERKSFTIPMTWIIPAEAHRRFLTEGVSFMKKLRNELDTLPDMIFAIRSSTNLEDSEKLSYAGQFRTQLQVRGKDEIVHAVTGIWESALENRDFAYPGKTEKTPEKIICAVIIQEMVQPVLAGVSFSRNPVNNLQEIIVEAVEGTGEELLQKGVTPLRWRMRGDRLLEGNGSFTHFDVIREVVSATRSLKRICRKDIDIEWAYNGKKLYFLQLRSITGSGSLKVYSNRMAREMLPGQIKPLVWSVNIPLVNGTWIGIIEEITGKLDIRPEDLAKSFHYRTYFNLAALGDLFQKIGLSVESLESMLTDETAGMPRFKPGIRSFRHIFRFFRFIRSKSGFEKFYLRQYDLLRKEVDALKEAVRNEFSTGNFHLLYGRTFLTAGRIVYLNIFAPLLMQYHHKKLRKKLESLGIDYGRLDFNRDFPLLSLFSPQMEMGIMRKELDKIPSGLLNDCETPDQLKTHPEAVDFLRHFEVFLNKFGHFSDSGNDFSKEKWEENPEFIYQMIRKSSAQSPSGDLKVFAELDLPWYRRRALHRLYQKAGRFRIYREQISSLYILGYGLFRTLFLKTGEELVRAGILKERSDIFYLTREEVETILSAGLHAPQTGYARIVALRQKEMEDSKDIPLPSVIIGDEAPDYEMGEKRSFRGVGTSPGKFTGKVKVLSGTADFHKIGNNDVLVIPFSDVSWTPVLVQAGAIISEAGGMLSHCSIIAREMSIPAIVSVDNACTLKDDMLVTVDGSNGLITTYGNN